MSKPTSKRKESKDKSTHELEEDVLQAVVLADSFDSRFKPLTYDVPRCLLPLCGVPLIEYTLEMLVLSNVKEIFVLCCYMADKIRDFLKNSKWGKNSTVKVNVIVTQQLYSVGEALRDIDSKSIIRSDFILISGDVVSNMKLQDAVNAHKERRKVNKDIIMTMVVKESTLDHPARYPETNPIYMLDSNTQECIYYDSFDALPPAQEINLSTEILAKSSKEFELRRDLVDCYIDICSLEVPALFTENFDYQDLRKDFVHGILTSDILGKSIYCHISTEGYAAKVSGPKMYDVVSRDVIKRWTFPLVPDTNLWNTNFRYSRRCVYLEPSVVLANTSLVERKSVIGANTTVGKDTRIVDSVIGKNCKIGEGVLLDGAYLFDGAIIENGSKVYKSILGREVTILKNTTINDGVIIASNSIVGPNVIIPKGTKIRSQIDENEDEEDEDEKPTLEKFGDLAYKFEDQFSDDEGSDSESPQYQIANFQLTQLYSPHPNLPQLVDTLTESENSEDEDEEESIDDDEERDLEFEREAKFTVDRAIKEGLTLDNAALELTALRMSFNAQFIQVRECVIPSLLSHLDLNRPLGSALKALFSKWAPLISKFTISEYDMVDAIDILMLSCADHPVSNASKMFSLSLKYWYDLDVVSEEAIIEWYESNEPDRLSDRLPEYKAIRLAAKPLVDWLAEAEEESD